MPMHIVIANLPPGVTPEGVKARFEELGVVGEITINREGDPGKVTAIIESDDLERVAADQIAYRIDGSLYHGRRLQSYVPLFLQGDAD